MARIPPRHLPPRTALDRALELIDLKYDALTRTFHELEILAALAGIAVRGIGNGVDDCRRAVAALQLDVRAHKEEALWIRRRSQRSSATGTPARSPSTSASSAKSLKRALSRGSVRPSARRASS